MKSLYYTSKDGLLNFKLTPFTFNNECQVSIRRAGMIVDVLLFDTAREALDYASEKLAAYNDTFHFKA